jgi:hypothetical protein
VRWEQISGAQVIVETDLPDFKVTPSEGTHFFQNLTSFQIGYLTVNHDRPRTPAAGSCSTRCRRRGRQPRAARAPGRAPLQGRRRRQEPAREDHLLRRANRPI